MPIQQATPYLYFNGTAADAIELYQSALGATVVSCQKFGDVDQSCSEADKDRVMHCFLEVGEAALMISDGPSDQEGVESGNVHVALEISDPDELDETFEALAQGGEVVMAVENTFWGARFGMVKDRYGIPWMLNCTLEQH